MSTSQTDAVGAAAAADPPAALRRQRVSAGGRRRLLVLLAVLSALLLAATAVLAFQVRDHNQLEQARDGALRAARQSAINLTTISADNFDEATRRVLDGATSDFKDEFAANSKNLKAVLTDNKVKASGEVLDAGLARSDRTTATALVVVNATVANVEVPEGRVNTYRMQLEVEKIGSRWLTSSLKFVG